MHNYNYLSRKEKLAFKNLDVAALEVVDFQKLFELLYIIVLTKSDYYLKFYGIRIFMPAKTLMVVGTASSAGKSLLVTALCRIFKRRGFRVAPFKSQNMSLNSFVTPEGHEMGRAQVSQAEAAGLVPSALMNPILLKPTTNRRSQVIVRGKVRADMSAPEYYAFKDSLKDEMLESFNTLAAQNDIIVIEGAGSPAEINLLDNDFVNLGLAAMLGAPTLLVGDIDRGGVFASLYGTVKLVPSEQQACIKGLVINKFRGDLKVLEPGLRQIEELLSLPVLGVLPYEKFAIDEEDSLTDRLGKRAGFKAKGALEIAVLRLPKISNFTDFAVFDALPNVELNYVEDESDLAKADLIIIPGSKNTIEDMYFLNESGLASALKEKAASGVPVVGICGGFQILGRTIHDPYGVEGASGASVEGLGLLEVATSFAADKHTRQAKLTVEAAVGPLTGCSGLQIDGYEIHMGETQSAPGVLSLGRGEGGSLGAVSADGKIIGTYLHGFFDNLEFTRRFLENITSPKAVPWSWEGGGNLKTYQDIKNKEYDRLADMVEANIPFEQLAKIAGL